MGNIREEIKSQIQTFIEDNPEHVVCTDIERILLMVEEMEITYLPLQEDGDSAGSVDRNAADRYAAVPNGAVPNGAVPSGAAGNGAVENGAAGNGADRCCGGKGAVALARVLAARG